MAPAPAFGSNGARWSNARQEPAEHCVRVSQHDGYPDGGWREENEDFDHMRVLDPVVEK